MGGFRAPFQKDPDMKVCMPEDFAMSMLFGADTQKDENGKFLDLDEPFASIAVQSYGGTIAPEAPSAA